MADFNWDELPAQIEQDKKPKRDTLTREEIPGAILKLAQANVGSDKFAYQPLPHKDLADDFMKFIRAAGDFTEPVTTVLARLVDEYPDPETGKTVKVKTGVMVRYSTGQRRGRKPEDEEAGNGEAGNGEAGNGEAGNGEAGNGEAGNAPAGNAPAGNGEAGNAPAGKRGAK